MTVSMSGIIITPQVISGTIDGLDDVTITNPVDGQVLTFDGTTLQWVNENPVPTNLSLGTIDGATVTILSSTGTSVTLPSASPTFAGVMTSSEHQKLAGIAAGATANQTDAYLLSRTNHTGTQTASTISNFVETAQDAVASLLVAGNNITLDYNDAANTLTISAASGVTGTNLTQGTRTATTVEITSSTGTAATLTAASDALAGVMTATDKAKLDAAQTNTYLLDRANHTNTQLAATISDFAEATEVAIDGYLEPGTNISFTYNSTTDKLIISAGGGAVSLPESQIAFGDVNNDITSSAELTYNNTTGDLVIGSTGPGAITSNTGETLTITGDAGIQLNTTTGVVSINAGTGTSIIESSTGEELVITGDTGLELKTNTGRVAVATGTASYNLPATDGTAGQSIVTNGAGDLSFQTISGGGGAVVLPETFIAYGSESDELTSSAALAFDEIADTLYVGSLAGNSLIESGLGQAATLLGDTGLTLRANTGGVTIEAGNASYVLPIANGTAGQAIVTNAAGDLYFDTIRVTLPETQVAYGSATDTVTGSAALTFDVTSDTLQVGSLGSNAEISPGSGQTMTVKGSAGLTLGTDTGRVTVTTGAASYKLPANDGTIGQAIVTDGAGNLSFQTISTGAVASVFGRTGAVTALSTDYAAFYATTAQGAKADTALQVIPYSDTNPLMNGVATQGVSTNVSRQDHVHPSDTTKVNVSLLGVADGVATLDATAKVPASQLPSYVDDVVEYPTLADFPATGETGKIYVAVDTGFSYRWSGTIYVLITNGAVQSVFGRTDVITAEAGDYAAFYATPTEVSSSMTAHTSAADPHPQYITADELPETTAAWYTTVVNGTDPAFYVASSDRSTNPESSVTATAIVAGPAVLIGQWIPATTYTSAFDLHETTIAYQYDIGLIAGFDGEVYSEMWLRKAAGGDTLLATSDKIFIINDRRLYSGSITIPGPVSVDVGDVMFSRVYLVQGGAIDDATVALYMEGNTVTRIITTNTKATYTPVTSVFNRTGGITAQAGDYAAFYATTAQGAKADSALQPGNNISVLNNNAGYITAAAIPVNPATTAAMVAYDGSISGLVGNTVQDAIDEIVAAPDTITSVFGRAGAVVAAEGDYTLELLGDVTISSPETNEVLTYTGTTWANVPSQSGAPSLTSTQIAVGTVTDTIGGDSEFTYANRLLKVGYNDVSGGIMINGATRSISAHPTDSHLNLITTGAGLIKVSDNIGYAAALGALSNILTDDALITKKYFKDNDQITVARMDALEQTIADQAALIESLRVQLTTLMNR